MEKNWIDEIREFVRKAMNKGLLIDAYKGNTPWKEDCSIYNFDIEHKVCITFHVWNNSLRIATEHGDLKVTYKLSKRDELELDALILSVEEYKEDMAMSEFNSFFNEMDKPTDINDLDNDDE